MANFKMNPGSAERDTPGGTSAKQTSTASKLFKKAKSLGKKYMEHQVAPYKAVVKKVKQIKAKHQAKKAIKGSAAEGATEALQSKAQSYSTRKKEGLPTSLPRMSAFVQETGQRMVELGYKNKKMQKTKKPVTKKVSTIEAKGIVVGEGANTLKGTTVTGKKPTYLKAMSKMTKGLKPKLKPTPNIKKKKSKVTERGRKEKIKYYKN